MRAARLAVTSLLAAVTAGLCAAQPPGVPISPAAPFRLNEIAPLPEAEGGPVWVELYNWGEAEASLAGWCLADATGVYTFPADVPSVPPEGVLLVVFGPDGSQVARLGPAPRPVLRVSDRPEFMRGLDDELALYSTTPPSARALVDFLSWGKRSETEQAKWADEGGLRTGPAIVTDPQSWDAVLGPGGSVSRPNQAWTDDAGQSRRGEYWVVGGLTSATPGATNPLPPPAPMAPRSGGREASAKNTAFVAFWPGKPPELRPDAYATHFQAAGDPEFRDLLVDVRTQVAYEHTPPLPAGEYYWRARCEGPGFETPWTEPVYLKVWVVRDRPGGPPPEPGGGGQPPPFPYVPTRHSPSAPPPVYRPRARITLRTPTTSDARS